MVHQKAQQPSFSAFFGNILLDYCGMRFYRIHISSGFSCFMMLVIKANAKVIVDFLDHILC